MGAAAGLATAGTGAGILDYNAAAKAQKAQKKGVKQTIGTYHQGLDNTALRYDQSRSTLDKILPLLAGAQSKALKLNAASGSSATANVLDREAAARGAEEQYLVGRGLGNSTAGRPANAAITNTTNRALMDINEAVTGRASNILQQGAGQQANAISQKAGTYTAQSAQEAALFEALAQFLGGVQHSAGPSALGGIAGIAKLLMGLPGGGGGSVGSSGASSIFPGTV